MKHAMVDIEAFGGGANGLIVSIAAVVFNPMRVETVGEIMLTPAYRVNIRVQSALDGGAEVEGRTLRWWMEQSDAARKALFEPVPVEETSALEGLRGWYAAHKLHGIWSHGSNFDLRLLRAAYARHGQSAPWHWRAEYDTRTLFKTLAFIRGEMPTWPENPLKHDPLQDALAQAQVVQDTFRRLKLRLDKPADSVVESKAQVEETLG